MQHLIKEGRLTTDTWQWVMDELTPEAGPIILPLHKLQQGSLIKAPTELGVWLNEDQFPDQVAEWLPKVSLVGLYFPAFTDGRNFSKARLLRERHHFKGDIRAFGHFLPDQAHYLLQCGVSSLAWRTPEEASTALKLLQTFSHQYQATSESPPLFQMR